MRIGTLIRSGVLRSRYFFVELVVVFIGVYAAFLLDAYRTDRAESAERDRVVGLVRVGVRELGGLFENIAAWHEGYDADYAAQLEAGACPDVGDFLYVQPQYPVDVIKFVLARESYGTLPLEMYVPLTEFSGGVERMMYTEEKLVDLAERWVPIDEVAESERARRMLDARRFLRYLQVRGRTAAELARRAEELGRKLEGFAG
ncbi:MAG: hypothetical protein R3F34_04265 [Planctomycetota bacterium]